VAFQTMSNSVLIIDDNQSVRKVMRSFFERLTDWTVKGEASDGVEAIQEAIELKPDLILLDFSMPNLNGVEAASVLKKLIPDVHIIVFTMFDDALGPRISLAVGIDLVVPKAAGLTSLVKSVQHFMGTAGLIKNTGKTDGRELCATD
jgi:DNA-binding NarL/FixJ family response regulator